MRLEDTPGIGIKVADERGEEETRSRSSTLAFYGEDVRDRSVKRQRLLLCLFSSGAQSGFSSAVPSPRIVSSVGETTQIGLARRLR
jgi:hypothetical protein